MYKSWRIIGHHTVDTISSLHSLIESEITLNESVVCVLQKEKRRFEKFFYKFLQF